MKIAEIIERLDAQVLCGQSRTQTEIDSAFGSDMMSDVLAFVTENTVLLTGLINVHVIRTAEMLDVSCVVFVRGKPIPEEIIHAADELGMTIMTTTRTIKRGTPMSE